MTKQERYGKNFVERHLENFVFNEQQNRCVSIAFWELRTADSLQVLIQGDAQGMDPAYRALANRVLAQFDRYVSMGERGLAQMLRGDMRFYCHSVQFQDHCYGRNLSYLRTGGFELLFWQDWPDEDCHISYVAQFTGSGLHLGLRVFSE